ncbi:MAG: hypothetical protein ACLUOI_09965 [Eisenbergiella sp.]
MKLLTNIYQVGGPSLTHFFDAAVYLMKGKDGWFLIDCGTPEGYEQIKENVKKQGWILLKSVLSWEPTAIMIMWGRPICGNRNSDAFCISMNWTGNRSRPETA